MELTYKEKKDFKSLWKEIPDIRLHGYDAQQGNYLIQGDNLEVMKSLITEHDMAGKVDLIYTDPPFSTKNIFMVSEKRASTISSSKKGKIAYSDTLSGCEFIEYLRQRLLLMHILLSETGSIYLHIDYKIGHYVKLIMDEVFGYENFQREIIWSIETASGFKSQANNWIRSHDTLLYYSKGKEFNFNKQFLELDLKTVRRYDKTDEDGKKYKIYYNPDGSERRVYLDTSKGRPVSSVWDDIIGFQTVNRSGEYINYPTQKPEDLLERIIKASSNEGDLVLDCFCGSGTTAAVAEKNNRRWMSCDLGRFAIHTTRKRMLGIENVKPFIVQNLGKYERQQWMISEFENPENRILQEKAYKHFIIELYHAKPLNGYTWIHGSKAGRLIHVGNVDAPVAVDDIKSTIKEFWHLVGKEKSVQTNGIDFLGWDFAFDINETAKQFASENKVDVVFKRIPREVLEKKAVEQGDIKFYELASLKISTKIESKKLTISLENLIIPPDDVPQDIQSKITHWRQWIDYWAVDWNYKDDTFHNEWQSYRTKQNPKIDLTVEHFYTTAGKYTVLIKVIDILGNDTTKVLNIDMK
jgi:adenine specific DNA methylase Mod